MGEGQSYEYRPPVQPPISPAYTTAVAMKRQHQQSSNTPSVLNLESENYLKVVAGDPQRCENTEQASVSDNQTDMANNDTKLKELHIGNHLNSSGSLEG